MVRSWGRGGGKAVSHSLPLTFGEKLHFIDYYWVKLHFNLGVGYREGRAAWTLQRRAQDVASPTSHFAWLSKGLLLPTIPQCFARLAPVHFVSEEAWVECQVCLPSKAVQAARRQERIGRYRLSYRISTNLIPV